MVKAFYDDAEATLRVKGVDCTTTIPLINGLKQGGLLSPILFNIYYGAIIRAAREEFKKSGPHLGVHIVYKPEGPLLGTDAQNRDASEPFTLYDLLYADDTLLMAESLQALQAMVDIFTRVCEAFGQQISAEKSKLLVVEGIHWRPPRPIEEEVMESQGINPPTEDDAPMPRPSITVNGIELEVVDFFSYLGSTESGGASHHGRGGGPPVQADEGNVLSRLQADLWSANDFDERTTTAVHLQGR
jgi:hypothetical protein